LPYSAPTRPSNITQEVRDFAAKQNSESYMASENIKRETPAEDAREGVEKLSKVYNETGRELYIGQGDRKHD
jgi:phosphomethylpyrimidine synthase